MPLSSVSDASFLTLTTSEDRNVGEGFKCTKDIKLVRDYDKTENHSLLNFFSVSPHW